MATNKFRTPSRGELFQSMVNNYEQYYIEGDTAITDLSEGSELGTLLNSICVELEALYLHDALLCDQKFVKTATGSFLDLLACEHHLTRQQGTYANTYCTFSIVGDLQTIDVIIPAGSHVIHRSNGNVYTVQNDVTITAGSRTATGRVVALYPGEAYNADINTLTAFESVSSFKNRVSVTNYSAVTGGTDTESDESLRQRILDSNLNSLFGSIGWYSNQLKQKRGVHDVNFVNPNTKNINHKVVDSKGVVSDCTSCTRVVYVNVDDNALTYSGESERETQIESVLFEVTTWLENQNNLVVGHKFHCQQAVERKVYFEIVAYDQGSPSEEELVEVLTAYLRGGSFSQGDVTYTYPGINIGGTMNRGSIMDALEKISCIDQVEAVNLLRHNENKRTEAHGNWTYIGDITSGSGSKSLYEHTDMYGFVFQALNVDKDDGEGLSSDYDFCYDVWGRMPFPEYTLAVDTCPILGNVSSKNKQYNESDQGGAEWYEQWYWYDPDYSTIIYRSLGSYESNFSTSTGSTSSTPTDAQTDDQG